MPRLMYLPLCGFHADTQTGLARAFQAKYDTLVCDYMRMSNCSAEVMIQFCEFKPDIVHMQIQGTDRIEPWVPMRMKELNPKVILTQWSGDVRAHAIPEMSHMGAKIDLTLLSGKGQIPMYERAGCRKVDYWQVAIDPAQQFPSKERTWEDRQQGIVFCGNNYSQFPASAERMALLQRLTREFPDFEVHGFGWETSNVRTLGTLAYLEQTNRYYHAKVSLGFNNFNDVPWYFSDRQLVAMAAGTAHLCHYIPELENIFEDGNHCVFYRNNDECLEKLRWLLDHPEERKKIGENGQVEVKRAHTWDIRVMEYTELLQKHFNFEFTPKG